MRQIQSPFAYFTDANGDSLDAGQIYIGTAGLNAEVSPVTVYWDEAGTQPAAQPLRTSRGHIVNGVTMAHVYVSAEDFSMTVKDRNGQIVEFSLNVEGSGSLRADLASAATGKGTDLIRYKPNYMSGIGRLLTLKQNEWLSITDFPGVVGDGTTDCLAPLLAGIAALPRFGGTDFEATYYDVLQTLVVPPGAFYFSDTLNLDVAVHFYGCGSSGGNQLGASRFIFPANKHGVVTHRYNTGVTGHDSEGIRFTGIAFCPKVYHDSGTLTKTGNWHGVWARARTFLKDCVIAGFSGNGFQVIATAGSGGATEGNANSWGFDTLVVSQCWGHAVYIAGADANAGHGFNLDARSCGLAGIYDFSFLGNTYVACHVAGCATRSCVTHAGHNWQCLNGASGASTTPGTDATVWYDLGAGGGFDAWSGSGTYVEAYSYWADNDSARNLFLGCYLEGGYAKSKIIAPSMCVGGANDFNGSPFVTAYFDGDGEMNDRTFFQLGSSRKRSLRIAPATTGVIAELKDMNESLGAWPWRQKMATGRVYWDWSSTDASLFEFTNSQATVANGFPREVAARVPESGGVAMRQGFFLGGNMKYIDTGAAEPTSGVWVRGDIRFNEAPTPGGYVGWVCTTTGTAGSTAVFKTFGAISA